MNMIHESDGTRLHLWLHHCINVYILSTETIRGTETILSTETP